MRKFVVLVLMTVLFAACDGRAVERLWNSADSSPGPTFGAGSGVCNVLFDPNGGEGEAYSQQVSCGKEEKLLHSAFTKTGYDFASWNTSSDGSGVSYADQCDEFKTDEDTTLYAQWSINDYTVSFDINGGDSGDMPSITREYGKTETLPKSVFVKNAPFYFKGWKDDDGNFYSDKADFTFPAKDVTLHAQWDQALCFVADEAGAKVGWKINGTLPYAVSLECSTDGLVWNEMSAGNDISLPNADDRLYVRGNNAGFSKSNIDYVQFEIKDGNVSAYGDVTYLLNPSGGVDVIPEYAFYCLFFDCLKLQKAPDLLAETLSDYSYSKMFSGCTGLRQPPVFKARTLDEYCCNGMFSYCTNLEKSPDLFAETLVKGCYGQMFSGCSNLAKISVYFSNWDLVNSGLENATNEWVQNVPVTSGCEFHSRYDLSENHNINQIPVNWSFCKDL